jgi:hypothetical protein
VLVDRRVALPRAVTGFDIARIVPEEIKELQEKEKGTK